MIRLVALAACLFACMSSANAEGDRRAQQAKAVEALVRKSTVRYVAVAADKAGRVVTVRDIVETRKDERTVRRMSDARLARKGPVEVAFPEVPTVDWCQSMAASQAEAAKTVIEHFDGKRHTSYYRQSADEWSGTLHAQPFHQLYAPDFLHGNFHELEEKLRHANDRVDLALFNGRKATMLFNKENGKSAVFVWDARDPTLPEWKFSLNGIGRDTLVERLKAAKGPDDLVAWKEANWRYHVISWLRVDGVPVPELVHLRFSKGKKGGQWAYAVTSVEPANAVAGKGLLPTELRTQKILVVDNLLRVKIRHLPDQKPLVEPFPKGMSAPMLPPSHPSPTFHLRWTFVLVGACLLVWATLWTRRVRRREYAG